MADGVGSLHTTLVICLHQQKLSKTDFSAIGHPEDGEFAQILLHCISYVYILFASYHIAETINYCRVQVD